jgi:carotenoid cleavage dioxygenase-like enzyme
VSHLPITARHGKTLSTTGRRPTDAPAWIDTVDNPYLHGVYAPTTREEAFVDLEVEGELPQDLVGAYFRNGPNSVYAPKNRYHWFDGDGMVHGLWFDGGRARYRNRHVQTRGLLAERDAGAAIWGGVLGPFDMSLPGGPLKDTANTDLITWQGRLLALWYESGRAHELDPRDLSTRGVFDAAGALPKRISAHSKTDPATGELIWFSYGDRPPYMRYGVLRPDGAVHATEIALPGPRRPHDLGVTPNYSILHDFPIFFDPALFARTGKRVPLFHPDVPTRYGVIPRYGTDAEVRWFEFEPCYMLHVVNCWEEGDEVVMVGCRTDDPSLKPDPADGKLAAMLSGIKLQANLYEWRMNLKTGATAERRLDTTNAEFPMINPAWLGRRNRYAWLAEIPYEIPATFDALIKHDLHTGAQQRWAYGPGVFGSEAPFAARAGVDTGAPGKEDDGYLVTFVTDTADWSSAALVFDAKDITVGPIARVRIPHRVPAGFHATWMAADELAAR